MYKYNCRWNQNRLSQTVNNNWLYWLHRRPTSPHWDRSNTAHPINNTLHYKKYTFFAPATYTAYALPINNEHKNIGKIKTRFIFAPLIYRCTKTAASTLVFTANCFITVICGCCRGTSSVFLGICTLCITAGCRPTCARTGVIRV